MHCLSCDEFLTDREASRKHAETGEHIDLCDDCFSHVIEVVFIPTVTNGQLDDVPSDGEYDESE